jgi:hypothetical protein
MALRRSFIAGAGTAGLLVAFAALLLVVAGALIGFRAWPGDGSVGDAGSIAIHDAQLTGLKAPTLLPPVAAPAQAATKAPAAVRHHASTAGAHKRHARDAQGVAGVRRTSGQDQGPASSGSAGSAGAAGGSPAAPVTGTGGNLMKDASDQVANTVHQVTQTAGGQLGGTSNPVGKVVVDTGNAVSKTVQDLGVRAGVKTKLP